MGSIGSWHLRARLHAENEKYPFNLNFSINAHPSPCPGAVSTSRPHVVREHAGGETRPRSSDGQTGSAAMLRRQNPLTPPTLTLCHHFLFPHGLQGLAAFPPHGLHGFIAFPPQGLQGFIALPPHGLQGFAALPPHGLHGFAALPPHGLQGLEAPAPGFLSVPMRLMSTLIVSLSFDPMTEPIDPPVIL